MCNSFQSPKSVFCGASFTLYDLQASDTSVLKSHPHWYSLISVLLLLSLNPNLVLNLGTHIATQALLLMTWTYGCSSSCWEVHLKAVFNLCTDGIIFFTTIHNYFKESAARPWRHKTALIALLSHHHAELQGWERNPFPRLRRTFYPQARHTADLRVLTLSLHPHHSIGLFTFLLAYSVDI